MAYSSQMELGGYRGIPKNERVSTETAVRLRHGYYACVSYVDAQVGKVLDTLNRLGLRDKTIVVIWGDHGFSLGEAGHWCKKTNFESDTRVPLLVRDVGVTETGVATDALIECVDLYPTLAELAGLPIPSGLDGQSFLKVLRNPELRGRDIALSQFARPFTPDAPKVMGYSVRTPAHRYTRWVRWPARELITEELYDYGDKRSVELLDALPIERVNLIGDPDYENLRNRMRVQMEELLRSRKLVPHQ